MTDFTISNNPPAPDETGADDEDELGDKYDWRFREFNGDETMVVAGDSPDDAWTRLHDEVGDDWLAWELLGFDDLVAEGTYNRQVSLDFAARNPDVTETWQADE